MPASNYAITFEGFDQLAAALDKFPQIASPVVVRAINIAIAQIHQNADDRYFLFKTPRSMRTGYLQASFGLGIERATENKWEGSIAPTAIYAPRVHRSNPFMDRIKSASEKNVEETMSDAVNKITEEIARAAN